jgi:WD40 repeat protein
MASRSARRFAWLVSLPLLVACTNYSDKEITAPLAAKSGFSDWSTPQPLSTINTTFSEQQPALSKDGLTLYFASNRPSGQDDHCDATSPPTCDLDIWVSQRACTECVWETPVNVGAPINTLSLDAAPALSRDEHQLFYTTDRTDLPGGQGERDIWVSWRDDVHNDLAWQTPVNLGSGVNNAGPDIAPSYFANEDMGVPQLYFNRGAMLGDIYVSELRDGTWGQATPVAELNSTAADQRPSIAHNGLEIYFWSNRSGAAHIWYATRLTVTDFWSAPTDLGSPVNTVPTQHPYIQRHGRTETLLVSRLTSAGSFDLYVSTRTRGGA